MKQFNSLHLYGRAESIRDKFLEALPVIAFFLLTFYAVIIMFGMQYTMVVSLGTLLFQVNYKKQHNSRSLLALILQQLFLAVLAYIATLNLCLSIGLNLVVPFWLIFSKASSFNQLGYFSSLMTFTFLQFMHLDGKGFAAQFLAMVFCCAAFYMAVFLWSRLRKKPDTEGTEQKTMELLGCILEKSLNAEKIDEELSRLFDLQRSLYAEAYQLKGKKHIVTAEGKLKYMFALLVQRTVYMVSGQSQILLPKDEAERELAIQLAAYMKEAGTKDFMHGEFGELKREGKRLLKISEKGKSDFCRSVTNFFRMYLLIFFQQGFKEEDIVDKRWTVPIDRRLKDHVIYRLRPDTFEMRFALRMSVVLIVGMSFNFFFPESHSYWFVMNSFLLLRPMYEDSNYRMKTRFLGTAAGSLIVTAVLPFCGSLPAYLIIASVMVACMYTATPGTTIHALFVTCFALTMTTMAVGHAAAAGILRMAYVMASVLFVLVINRFFFPTSFKSQLKYNLQLLFHMHHMYLRILENSLTGPLDYWRVCDAQLQYHMVHRQIRQELPMAAKGDEDGYMKILSITWRMASEVQQMLFHVRHKRRGEEARQILRQYIYYNDYVLNQIQEMLHLKKEKRLKNIEGMRYQRYIEDEPELSTLMTQYARNLSRLYILVLRRYRM